MDPEINPDLALHKRLLERDLQAPHDCVVRWLPELIKMLCSKFPQVAARDEHMVQSAALDALFEYTRNPDRYNPHESSLQSYLYMVASRDLINSLHRDKTQSRDATPLDSVEQRHIGGNNGIEEQLVDLMAAQEIMDKVWAMFPDPQDRRILRLILCGERSTTAFARVLGILDLPMEAQKRIVKQNKDRIIKRLKRRLKEII